MGCAIIEDGESSFSGDGAYNVCHWVEEFDKISGTVNYSSFQKLVYAKQLLKKDAEFFVGSLSGIRDW